MKTEPHEPAGRWKRRHRLPRKAIGGLLPVLAMGWVLSTVGCTSLSQGFAPYSQSGCRLCTDIRARATARALWNSQYSHCYGNAANAKDIRKGFADGFADTAAGGNGCTPLVPPNCYCGFGKRLDAKAWFQGYPLGVAAAQSSGACDWCKTAISPDLAACMATNQCTPGCIPCAPNAGVMHPGMVHDSFNAPPIPMDMQGTPMTSDPNESMDQGIPTPAPLSDDESELDSEEAASDVQERAERNSFQEMETEDIRVEPSPEELSVPKAAVEEASPSDLEAPAPAPEPLERDDDLTKRGGTKAATETVSIPVQRPTQEAPIVGSPIAQPVIDAETNLKPEAAEDVESPVVGAPVELPNIQVSFDMQGVDWLFGEVDIAQAVLAQEIQSVLPQE